MENGRVAVLVLAVAAALVVGSAATYAMMGRQTSGAVSPYGGNVNGYGMGPSMMRGSTGFQGGMMGERGMMGAWNGTSLMYEHMQQMHDYMQHYWNSTTP